MLSYINRKSNAKNKLESQLLGYHEWSHDGCCAHSVRLDVNFPVWSNQQMVPFEQGWLFSVPPNVCAPIHPPNLNYPGWSHQKLVPFRPGWPFSRSDAIFTGFGIYSSTHPPNFNFLDSSYKIWQFSIESTTTSTSCTCNHFITFFHYITSIWQ
jgi:hypothetical protein